MEDDFNAYAGTGQPSAGAGEENFEIHERK
jgi:hypothetical protein